MKASRLRWVSFAWVIALTSGAMTASAGPVRDALINLGTPKTQPAAAQVPVQTFEAVDQPLKTDGAPDQQAEWLKAFHHAAERFEYTFQLVADEETLRIYRIRFPSPVKSPWPENNTVTAELYLPREVNGRAPASLVLDILDGSAIVPRGMARGMAEAGVVALYVPMACYGPRRPAGNAHFEAFRNDPTRAVDNVRQTVMDLRRAKAVLATRPEVDPDRIGITGVSLGGIVTALTAGVDGTFHRVVPIMAGGDLAAITFHARETRVMRSVLQGKGMGLAEAGKLMAPIDPLRFASRIDPRTCLMINASRDEVIPKATTEALHKAMGQPQILWMPAGHYSAVFFMPNIRQRTIEFVQGKRVDKLDF